VTAGCRNAIDGVSVGVKKIGTRSDEDVNASTPRGFPFARKELDLTQYVTIDIRAIEKCPNLGFEHCKIFGGFEIAIQYIPSILLLFVHIEPDRRAGLHISSSCE
jgi:hypothetical protein